MPNTFNPEFMPIYWLSNDGKKKEGEEKERKQLVNQLLTKYPTEPFLHYWRVAGAEYYSNDEVTESLDIIFAATDTPGKFARSLLLYQSNSASPILNYKDIKNGEYYNSVNKDIERKITQINSQFALDEDNKPFLSLTKSCDLPMIYGFDGLKQCAEENYYPAHLILATEHYKNNARQENEFQQDQSLFYYTGLHHLNECKDFELAQTEKVCSLLDIVPLMDERGNCFDAKSLLEYCQTMPSSDIHKKYAASLGCYAKNYALLTSNSYKDHCTLLSSIALKLALNYYKCVNALSNHGQNREIIDIFKENAEKQIDIAVAHGFYEAKLFKAYLIGKKTFGKTFLYKPMLEDLLKNPFPSNPDNLAESSNYKLDYTFFADFIEDMEKTFQEYKNIFNIDNPLNVEQVQKVIKHKPSSVINFVIEKMKPSNNLNNLANKLKLASIQKAFYEIILQPVVEILNFSEMASKATVEAIISPFIPKKKRTDIIIHPMAADLSQVLEENEFVQINNYPENKLLTFFKSLDAFKELKLQQDSVGYFSKNILGDYDTVLLMKICHYLNNTGNDDNLTILKNIEQIAFFNRRALYDTKGKLATYIDNIYETYNDFYKPEVLVVKPNAQAQEPHIAIFNAIIHQYETIINQRFYQFTEPQRIQVIFILRQGLNKLQDSDISMEQFLKNVQELFNQFDNGELGDMLSALIRSVKQQLLIESIEKKRVEHMFYKITGGGKFGLFDGNEKVVDELPENTPVPIKDKKSRCCFNKA